MINIEHKERADIRYKISYIQNLISVLNDLIKYHESSFKSDFTVYLKNTTSELSKYFSEMNNLMSENEKELLVSEPIDFGSYYSSVNTTSEAHKYELLQEAYTQSFGIQEHFNKFQEFPNHLKYTAQKIHECVNENEVYQTIEKHMNNK